MSKAKMVRSESEEGRRWTEARDGADRDHPMSVQSLPSQGTVGPSLWNAVRGRVQVSAALRQASERYRRSFIDSEGRIDAEGITSDTLRSRNNGSIRPGQHADQWLNLAHLFDEDDDDERRQHRESKRRSKRSSSSRPARTASPATNPHSMRRDTRLPSSTYTDGPDDADQSFASTISAERPIPSPSSSPERTYHGPAPPLSPSPPPSQSSATGLKQKFVSWRRMVSPPAPELVSRPTSERPNGPHITIIDEPSSWLRNDPDDTPEGADPLLYSNQDQLLETDSDSSESELDEWKPKQAAHGLDTIDESSEPSPNKSVESSKVARTLRTGVDRAKWIFSTSQLQKNIAKCAIAYFIASLFTFSPHISSWMSSLLPNHDADARVPFSNLHMIATVAVYFHPAKTLGAMLEADVFAVGAFVFSVVLGFTSMAIAVFLHEAELLFVSDIMSVLVFLGFGMALVGYAKVKVNKPQFNTACSLINIIVFTVVVKEGSKHLGHFSTEKTFQVALCVAAGSLISNLVCFTFWPQSATTNLQNDIERNLKGFATLLRVLTKTFLLDDPSNFHFRSEQIKRAIDDHHDSFTSLRKNLGEAMLEGFFDLRMRGMRSKYVAATDSMNRLAQHLAGLRSSCGLQHQIMMAHKEARKARASGSSGQENARADADQPGLSGLEIAEAMLTNEEPPSNVSEQRAQETSAQERATAFEDFIQSIGPHMRSLVFTCSRTLKNLRSTFMARHRTHRHAFTGTGRVANGDADRTGRRGSHFIPGASFELLEQDVAAALRRFQHEQTVAIKRIYTMEPKATDKNKVDSVVAAAAAAAAASAAGKAGYSTRQDQTNKVNPDEEIFLIFFFVFNLEEFAKELQVLIEALEIIRQGEVKIAGARATSWWQRVKLFFLTMKSPSTRRTGSWLRRFIGGGSKKRSGRRSSSAVLDFPSNRRHVVNTAQTPAAMTTKQRFQKLIWSLGEFLRQPDTKFAIKAGVGSAMLASPAFFPSTRHIFTKFQGQWALVSFMVVLSPTVGQSNQMSLHRILGTIFGAATAVGIYSLFPDNNVVLPIFGVIFSLPCFKYIVARPQLASSGRFVLLTYNLTALYSYNLRKVGIEVEQIAFQRALSVVIGVLWATILNQLVWPFEARRELALGVSDLIFKLAWLYQRLVLSYSQDRTGDASEDEGDEDGYADSDREDQPLLRSRQNRIADEFQTIELHLQVSIIKLEGLLAQTKHEPRLKGPFPVATYKAMLGCCQNMLDKLHSMRCVTTREDWYRSVRRDFVIPVNAERREMVGNVLLFFYTLGSAFHLKIPVPPYFPPASQCRQRLLEKIRELPVVKRRAVRGSSAYLLFYSYALAMKDVIDQLEELGRLTQENFGIWGGSIQNFEQHFEASAESAQPTPYASQRSSRAWPSSSR